MNRNLAEMLAAELRKLSEPINALSSLSLQLEDRKDAESLRGHLGTAMFEIDDIWRLISKRFPDIRPDASQP